MMNTFNMKEAKTNKGEKNQLFKKKTAYYKQLIHEETLKPTK